MKNVLVIGGSTGIGAALVNTLAEGGHRVWATYHQHPPQPQQGCTFHPLNVLNDNPDWSFLPAELDALVYCPGSINLKPFLRILPRDFAADYQLNVVGAVKSIQAALPSLKAGTQPAIVLFSTVAVGVGMNFHTQVAASKGAIEGLTRALSAELAPRVRVNCIAPSLTDTPLSAALLSTPEKREASAQRHPLKRTGTAAEMAALAQFLISEQAGFITGQVIHADGGLSAIKA